MSILIVNLASAWRFVHCATWYILIFEKMRFSKL